MKQPKFALLVSLALCSTGLRAQSGPVYQYSVPTGGYAANGNLTSSTDSVNGQWGDLKYDGVNRLISGKLSRTSQADLYFCWAYDSFGNRTTQATSDQTFQTADGASCQAAGTLISNVVTTLAPLSPSNQIIGTNATGTSTAPKYDNAGNMISNDNNLAVQYVYDAENRLCAAQSPSATGGSTITLYLYDAEGHRIAKGHPASSSASLACPTGAGDFVPDQSYILGRGGEQVTQLDQTDSWQHTNVYANGQLLATYSQEGSARLLHFNIADPLGTKRVQTSALGAPELNWTSLPFGDDLASTGPGEDATQHHFTGKERDMESGLDYFQFRSYASTMGRWISPDPAGMMAADIEYPQTLNRYAYVNNSPLGFTDPLGLDCAYLNDSGTDVENFDQRGTHDECGMTKGYWVDGGLTDAKINAETGTVQLTGTNNGTDQTHASYQDTSVYVGWYDNTSWNPAGHIAMAFPGQTPVGFNPLSDSDFKKAAFIKGWRNARVPGAVTKQVGGQLKQTVRIPLTGMQAQMIQDAINQSTANPGNYTLGEGNGCDCGTWAQQMLGDAGINSGSSARLPSNLMPQLQQLYPQP